ncbi:unnamed protein product, partial [Phaeothamnion confervicola]
MLQNLPPVNRPRRTRVSRRQRALVRQFAAELGGDLSPTEASLVQQAAALVVQAEGLQRAMRKGEPVSVDDMVRASGETRRTLSALKRERARR